MGLVLEGGAGADTFIFLADQGNDTILDFRQGEDRMAVPGGDEFVQIVGRDPTGAILIDIDAPRGRTSPGDDDLVTVIGLDPFQDLLRTDFIPV